MACIICKQISSDKKEVDSVFTIQYMITTDKKEMGLRTAEDFGENWKIEGYIQLDFDGNLYGYCPDPSGEYGAGWDLLNVWFSSLLKSIEIIRDTGYVVINDIESYDSSLEFVRDGNNVVTSIVRWEKENGTSYLSFSLPPHKYGKWNGIRIGFDEYRKEVINKATQYVNELVSMNKNVNESVMISKMRILISAASVEK